MDNLERQEKDEGFSEASHKAGRFFGAKHKEITTKQRYRVEKVFASVMKRLGYSDKRKAA